MTLASDREHGHDRRLRLLRIVGIAVSAIILCSCRSLSTTALTLALFDEGSVAEEPAADVCPAGQASSLPRRRPPCPGNACRPGLRDAEPCPSGACAPMACVPIVVVPPVAVPCPICDGGDHHVPAKPVGEDAIANLTAGDTVARYRAADHGPDHDDVHLTASNCTCVYAPKFASVRQIAIPSEDAARLGPKGLALDVPVAAEVRLDPVWGSVQNLAPEAARKAQPGIAIEERLSALAVDQGDLPNEADQTEQPVARVADQQPELAERTQGPALMVGFDVPMAWTCVQAANVLVNEQAARVVTVDRGTATLRFEEPGRAELTLCKRAGSDTARVGEELDFTIFMLNSGDRALTDIVLVDALPHRLTLIPESPAASLPADFSTEEGDDGSTVVKWRFRDPLPAGASGFVRFRTMVR